MLNATDTKPKLNTYVSCMPTIMLCTTKLMKLPSNFFERHNAHSNWLSTLGPAQYHRQPTPTNSDNIGAENRNNEFRLAHFSRGFLPFSSLITLRKFDFNSSYR